MHLIYEKKEPKIRLTTEEDSNKTHCHSSLRSDE